MLDSSFAQRLSCVCFIQNTTFLGGSEAKPSLLPRLLVGVIPIDFMLHFVSEKFHVGVIPAFYPGNRVRFGSWAGFSLLDDDRDGDLDLVRIAGDQRLSYENLGAGRFAARRDDKLVPAFVLFRDGNRCRQCGVRVTHETSQADHIQPVKSIASIGDTP